jgi:tRNA G18 (ribose-2'-O)-methylase SpoU
VTTSSSRNRPTPIGAGHPYVRRYLLARRNALPRHESVVAIAGMWAHQQALRLGASFEVFLYCPGEDSADRGLTTVVEALLGTADASYEISARTLARLHPGANAPGLLSLVRLPGWDAAPVLDGAAGTVLVADGIEYAGNLGALIRTVDASGADALVLTNPVARLTHPTVFSASRGTVLTTPTLEFTSVEGARGALATAGFEIVVADPAAVVDFRELRYGGPRTALVVGAEGAGVTDAWRAAASYRVSISMHGRADSLNVATAAAVLLFHAGR